VKIKGTCRRCGREFLVEQVLANGGECPWDGKPFQPDYAVVLVDALRDAEQTGSALEDALRKMADLEPDFVLDVDSVLDELRSQLERLERSHAHGSPARS
jgi:predicted GTPase